MSTYVSPNIFAPVQVTTTGKSQVMTDISKRDLDEMLRLMQELKNQPQNIMAGATTQVIHTSLSEYTVDELREELRLRAVNNLYRGDAVSEQELDRLAQWCLINPDKLSQLVMMIGLPVPSCEAVWTSGRTTERKACGAPVLYRTDGHAYCPPCAETYKQIETEDKRIRWSATT